MHPKYIYSENTYIKKNIIINPYGGVYPEVDTIKHLSLNKIFD